VIVVTKDFQGQRNQANLLQGIIRRGVIHHANPPQFNTRLVSRRDRGQALEKLKSRIPIDDYDVEGSGHDMG
jgi:hypothetical protein